MCVSNDAGISPRDLLSNQINDIIAHFCEKVNRAKWEKIFPCNSTKTGQVSLPVCFMAIPHKDCATDASSNFSSDETKSGVNT